MGDNCDLHSECSCGFMGYNCDRHLRSTVELIHFTDARRWTDWWIAIVNHIVTGCHSNYNGVSWFIRTWLVPGDITMCPITANHLNHLKQRPYKAAHLPHMPTSVFLPPALKSYVAQPWRAYELFFGRNAERHHAHWAWTCGVTVILISASFGFPPWYMGRPFPPSVSFSALVSGTPLLVSGCYDFWRDGVCVLLLLSFSMYFRGNWMLAYVYLACSLSYIPTYAAVRGIIMISSEP